MVRCESESVEIVTLHARGTCVCVDSINGKRILLPLVVSPGGGKNLTDRDQVLRVRASEPVDDTSQRDACRPWTGFVGTERGEFSAHSGTGCFMPTLHWDDMHVHCSD